MFQNHLLQVLTLVAMEDPARYTADNLRNEKMKVLSTRSPCRPATTAREGAWRSGQYEGYRAGAGRAARTRKTPTYAAVRLEVDNRRWHGVPFYLRSGKGLTSRYSEVMIQFRCPPHLMFPLPPGRGAAVQPADDGDPAERGHPPQLPDEGAGRGRRAAAARAT